MPQLRFKRFNDLTFLQTINNRDQFVPLLTTWKSDLLRLGLDIDSLQNDDASSRRLMETFTQTDKLPGDLLNILYVLDDLSDETGQERLMHQIETDGAQDDIPGLDGELSPADLAILVQLNKPEILQACYDEGTPRKARKFIEWRASNTRPLTLASAKRRKGRLERDMANWFAGKGRGRVCDVHVYEEQGELRFVITHGLTYRSEGSYTSDLKRARAAYRPQRHDLVIWDPRRRVLMVSAATRPEQQQYRCAFGSVFWGSETYFSSDDIYTLAALQEPNCTLSTAFGVTASRLVEVVVSMDDAHTTRQVTTGTNLLASARELRTPNLARGTIVSAGFLLSYESGGRARRLDIKLPNVADFDRDRDGVAARAWLEENGFLVDHEAVAEAEDDDDTEDDDGSVSAVAGR